MQRLVAVTATMLWLPCHRLEKDCKGKWKVSQNNSAETLKQICFVNTAKQSGVWERRREAASYHVTPQRAVFPWGSLIPRILSVLAATQPRVLLLCLGAARTDCSQEHGLCTGYALAGDRERRDDGISILFIYLFLNLAWVRFSQWPR